MKQHIFLRGNYLGARDIPTWASLGEGAKPTNSVVLFCPLCADIWAKLMHDAPQAYCQVVTCHCQEHAYFPSDGTITSPSHFEGDPRAYVEEGWPRAVLLHDVGSLSNYFLNHPDRYPHESR